ncbi:TonB-dependent receptor [Hymenobacter sp. RP-2-7]|uniref:TonB-dependent receptor n=1 Tax=Hymenobacter polaris TaxID=2682546 RepID=A0A7Y0FMN8_9BACT|nr:TonB-dependent receptor [Hymenobacter polaris]NML66073.1 TonB-dependent receptor [Hymenobacter polaris]
MRPLYSAFCGLLFLPLSVLAGTIRGRVMDARTGEPLVGAIVHLQGTPHNAQVQLDGTFVLRNVPAGEYELASQFVGYQVHSQHVSLTTAQPDQVLSLRLRDKDNALEEVTVQGRRDPEGETTARRAEQLAPSIVNVVSAQAIQVSPDIQVANVLQRVSGVTLERSTNGDGRYAILRGMDKRYNYTLVNGIKIPSPDPYNRYVPLDIFPADLLQRLEVTKALTPSMEGDAIGGVVNLVMKDAPAERTWSGQLGTGYGQLFFDRSLLSFDRGAINRQSPAARNGSDYQATLGDFPWAKFSNKTALPNLLGNLTFGSRYGQNQRLGVLLAGSYQAQTRGSDGYFYETGITQDNYPVLRTLHVQQYSTRQERLGLNAKLDYRLDSRNTLRFYGAYLQLDEAQARFETDTTYKGMARPDVDRRLRSRLQRQSIANGTLQGDHQLTDRLSVNWSAVYSRAANNVPDVAEQDLKLTTAGNRWQDVSRIWLDNTDQDKAAYLNLKYQLAEGLELGLGGLYRDKDRVNHYLSYQLRASGQLASNEQDISSEPYSVFNPQGIYVGNNNYSATEKIAAGYGQLRLARGAWEVLGGLRAEHTNQAYLTSLPITEAAYKGRQLYTDWLPSLHLRYALSARQNLRASYFASLSRPSFFELTPHNNAGSVSESNIYPEAGNPYLLHTKAQNLDLRYELFGAGNDQVMVGAFYKNLQNPIEYALVALPNTTVTVYQPSNFGTATNYGFEWVGVKFFGPLGLSTNYTFTHSEITTLKARNATADDASLSVPQKRPLQGQAKHVANASLLYKNPALGLDVQLAYVYTGARIVQVGQYLGLDYWQRAQSQLDFSAEKRLSRADKAHSLTAYVKVQNLLNTPYQVDILAPGAPASAGSPATTAFPYQDRADRVAVINQTYRAYYLAGLRFRF